MMTRGRDHLGFSGPAEKGIKRKEERRGERDQ